MARKGERQRRHPRGGRTPCGVAARRRVGSSPETPTPAPPRAPGSLPEAPAPRGANSRVQVVGSLPEAPTPTPPRAPGSSPESPAPRGGEEREAAEEARSGERDKDRARERPPASAHSSPSPTGLRGDGSAASTSPPSAAKGVATSVEGALRRSEAARRLRARAARFRLERDGEVGPSTSIVPKAAS
jgi:hypothetical protein